MESTLRTDEENDKICLLGFSTGAYIARVLAGMLHFAGLLPKGSKGSIRSAYKLYARNDKQISILMKQTMSRKVEIDFVGVWDTVVPASLSSETLPFTESNPAIKTFRHALALDECRTNFAPLHYTPDPKNDSALAVWFSGCNGDVGGGSDQSRTAPSLARVTLRWMVGECLDADTGILFKEANLHDLIKTPQEDSLAAEDSESVTDELNSKLNLRWGLEILPRRNRQSWLLLRGPNFGRGRTIQGEPIMCHRTVQTRINAPLQPNYVARAKWTGYPILDDSGWVDSNLQQLRYLLANSGHV